MSIQVLPKQIAELIAAGEAVERPASVVKELVENAIDAGATNITIEIRNGGVSYLRITDNGCGIAPDEVKTAFLRHATSKVATADDLQKIGTLGFRGEALASICAVAKVQMLTSTDGIEGVDYIIEGGEEKQCGPSGCPKGTTIIVRDLFYNTPARMKFLKTDMGEGNAVAGVVDKIALSHPEVSFRFIRDSKPMLSTPGNGDLKAAAYAVYGNDFVKDSIAVDYTVGGIRVHGLVSKPAASRKSRAMQHFYINGRYIRSGTLAKALENAYKTSIMVGRFAACVLFIEMPYHLVDINVHPTKLECRFADERPIFEAVYFGVKTAVEQGDTRSELKLKPNRPVTQPPQASWSEVRFAPKSDPVSPKVVQTYLSHLDDLKNTPIAADKPLVLKEDTKPTFMEQKFDKLDILCDDEPQQPIEQSTPVTQKQELVTTEEETKEVDIKLIGEAFRTYILCECGDDLILIDKHAAHERMIYEKIKDRSFADAQELLSPVSVTLSKEECDALMQHAQQISQLGFEIEYFGGSNVLVRTVPMILAYDNIASLVQEIAAGFLSHSDQVELEHLDWLYHSMSCRAAVKGGDQSGEDLMIIAKRVAEQGDIRYCPHGRPVAYKLTKKELDKQFGRLG